MIRKRAKTVVAVSPVVLPITIGAPSSRHGWVAEVLAPSTGGRVARRLLPAALGIPVGIGALVLAGYRAHLYDPAFASALMAIVETVSFVLVVSASARALNATECERQHSQVDELTLLKNRRGFLAAGEASLRTCAAAGEGALVVFIDLGGMKRINGQFGHHVGDLALTETADILRAAFHNVDVIARLGGDEFVAFVPRATEADVDDIVTRLRERLDKRNEGTVMPYRLALSVGVTPFVAGSTETLRELLARADATMYADKIQRRRDTSTQRSDAPPPSVRLSTRPAAITETATLETMLRAAPN